MLRITMQSNANATAHYFEEGHDYLAEGLEHVGGWGGQGAKLLGLDGPVGSREFAELCHNRHPDTGRKLTIGRKDSTRVGYDMTFSAPKSVTLALEVTQDARILEAFGQAVSDTLRDIEAEAVTRDQRGGEQRFVPADLVHATFVHRSARPVGGLPDPQLHAHAFVFNVSHAGGRWTTPELGNVKSQARSGRPCSPPGWPNRWWTWATGCVGRASSSRWRGSATSWWRRSPAARS